MTDRAGFRLRAPQSEAIARFAAWAGWEVPEDLEKWDAVARDEGWTLLVSEQDGWTLFEDREDVFHYIGSEEWLKLAATDSFLYASHYEAIGSAWLVALEGGAVVREIQLLRDTPESDVNVGRLDTEKERIESWGDVANFADDVLTFTREALLKARVWRGTPLLEPKPEKPAPENLDANIARWVADGHAREWVAARQARWRWSDWEALVEELKKSSYWPLNPERVGEEIEKASRAWRRS